MIVESIDVGRFGALRGRRFELGPGVWILEGPNEAGKTSLQRAVRALLYGFDARSSARHPAGTEGATLQVSGIVSGPLGRARVARALGDHATVAIGAPGDAAAERRGDDPIPGIAPAALTAFDQLHRLSPDEQLEFGSDPGPELDRLLMGDGQHGASVRALLEEIEAERTALWRPDRRSKRTRSIQLDAELARVAEESRAARAVEEGLVQLEGRAAELRRRRDELGDELRRRESELEALGTCERIARAARDLGGDAAVDLAAIEGETLEAPGPLLAALEEAEESAAAPRERLARETITRQSTDDAVLARAGEIEAAARSAAEHARLRALALDAREEAASSAREGAELARTVLRGERLPGPEALAALEAALAQGGAPAMVHGPSSARIGAALVIGAAGAAGSALTSQWWPAAIAAVLAPLPLALRPGASSGADPHVEALLAAARRAGLDDRWCGTREGIAAAADRLRRAANLTARAEERAAAAERAGSAADELTETWRRLAEDVGCELDDATAAPEVLALALDGARRREVAWTRDHAERSAASAALERAETRAREIGARFEALSEALRRAVPSERAVERAHERLTQALGARERARGAMRELLADPALEALGDDQALAAARAGRFEASAVRRAEVELDALRAETGRVADELVRADERLRRERPARTTSELDSERAALLEEREEVLARHDELALASALLREGERRHRARHQSSILGRASRLLGAVTGGRHSELEYGQLGDGPRAEGLTVLDGARGARVTVGPALSRGTREQVHLCLRLAAVAELAGEEGAAPLLLDEAFAHWDAERRGGAAAALADFAREHSIQVLLFTCHGFLAEELAAATGGRRIAI